MPHDLSFVRHFSHLTDPRVDRTKKHRLDDILVIALCEVISGADSFEEIERFGEARREWLGRFLRLPNGIPATTRSTASSPPWTVTSSPPASPRGWRRC